MSDNRFIVYDNGGETRQEARFHAMTEALPKILEIIGGQDD